MDKVKLNLLEIFFASATIPESIFLNPGENISDLPRFLESHFTALKGDCPPVLQEPYFSRLMKLQLLLTPAK
jgi:hypothetical protein